MVQESGVTKKLSADKMLQCGKDIGVSKPLDFLACVLHLPFFHLFSCSTSPYKEFVKAEGLHILLRDSLNFLSQGLQYLAHRYSKTCYLCRLGTDEFSFSVSWSLN